MFQSVVERFKCGRESSNQSKRDNPIPAVPETSALLTGNGYGNVNVYNHHYQQITLTLTVQAHKESVQSNTDGCFLRANERTEPGESGSKKANFLQQIFKDSREPCRRT